MLPAGRREEERQLGVRRHVVLMKVVRVVTRFAQCLFALGLLACSDGSAARIGAAGSASFALSIPGGDQVSTVQLFLLCPAGGISRAHTLDAARGEVIASFGGLPPGTCTAEMKTTSVAGAFCRGSQTFTVLAGRRVDVLVTLLCQGANASPSGGALVSPRLERQDCERDRIKKVFTLDSNILLGSFTDIEAQIHPEAVRGMVRPFVWSLRNDDDHEADGILSEVPCSSGSASCQRFLCTGTGRNPGLDPRTGMVFGSVRVSATYEDDECQDTEEVVVKCLRTTFCGDFLSEGPEQCDDGNAADGDGCSSSCRREYCGDGIVSPALGEECEMGIPVPSGPQDEKAVCEGCKKVPILFCGDGIKNGAEECDGTDGVQAGQVCSRDCRWVPECGNGVIDADEECDDTGPACGRAGTPEACQRLSRCLPCIAGLPDVGAFNAEVCQPNTLCSAALSCLINNPVCWSDVSPAACYCGSAQSDIDACENPTFVPRGPCAAELFAGAGTFSSSSVLQRYWDYNYPTGQATIIWDAAFLGCHSECFLK